MNVAFCIRRTNYIGSFGPLIECFREKGAKIILLCGHSQNPRKHGYKAYLYPYKDKVKGIFSSETVLSYRSNAELAEIIRQNGIRVIFSLTFDKIADDIRATGNVSDELLIAYVQTGFDMIYCGVMGFSSDVVYIFSDLWRQCWKKALIHQEGKSEKAKKLLEKIDNRTIITGFPQIDQMKGFNRKEICEKYGLPRDKKILVLLPFPWRVPFCVWSHIIYKPQNKLLKLLRLAVMREWSKMAEVFTMADDRKITAAIRRFADKNDAFFIVKGRLKNKVPAYLAKVADKVIFDGSFYPYTIMELLFVADLCIHFYSDAVKECVATNTPSICLGPTNPNDWECYAKRFFLEEFSPIEPSYYNFGSVSYNESVDDFAESFAEKSFEDYTIKPAEKSEFMEKFLGFDDLNGCNRVYEDIERRLNE